MNLGNVSAPPVLSCLELKAPPGAALDALLAVLTCGGFSIEALAPIGDRYRITGTALILEALAKEFTKQLAEKSIAGWSLAPEVAPTSTIGYTAEVAPAAPFRRTVLLHGMSDDAFRHHRLAIDARLQVAPKGVFRWAIAGRTSALMAWMAEACGKPIEEVLTIWNLTPDDVTAEDTPAPVVVHVPVTVTLPATRTTTTAIQRNAAGEIIRVDQKTVDVD